jgi:hypothetical protein
MPDLVMPKVNEAIVKRIIEDALTKEKGATINEKVYKAFRTLQARRRSKEWNNVELAAAEHYMYARFLAGATGDPAVLAAPNLYNLKKKVFFALDIQDLMATSKYPGLPPSDESVSWGERGAGDGLMDFKGANPATDFKVGEALKPLVKGSY